MAMTPAQVNEIYDNAVADLAALDTKCDELWYAMMRGSEADATSPNGVNYVAWSEAADKCRALRETFGFTGMTAEEAKGVLPDYERYGC